MTKEYDVVIFGASGFTGQLVVEELARNATQEKIKWAVAGRNPRRVQQTLVEAQKSVSNNLKGIKVLEADVNNNTSLENMCKNTRLIINCVGPYEKYGEPVVTACLKYNTHIIDMAVENMFVNRMILKYYHEAESQGVYIVSACGIGYLFYEMVFPVMQQKFEGGIDAIELYVKPEIKTRSIHFATWESYINMSDGISEVLDSRQKIYSQVIKKPQSKWSVLSLSSPIKRCEEIDGISFNIPSILLLTHLGRDMKEDAFKEKPIKLNSYCVVKSTWSLILCLVAIFITICLTSFSFGRRMLTNYPGLFSFGVVTKSTLSEEERDSAIANFYAVGRGWSKTQNKGKPDKTVVLQGCGPPAYRNTAICLVQAAITVLQETDRLPHRGGIYTPLAAFLKTSLPSRLHKHGITYKEKEQ